MHQNRTTLVIGATPNPARVAFTAVHMLQDYRHDILLFGIKKGEVGGMPILNEFPSQHEVDTITLYISAKWQAPYYQKMIDLKPRRIIFNPGTENMEFRAMAEEAGIECLEACTLVMLRTGQY